MQSLNQRLLVFEQDKVLFKIDTNLETNQTFASGTVAQFNSIKFSYPMTSSFNTSTFTYTVPRNGIYQFGFNLFHQSSTTSNGRFAIYKNDVPIAITGALTANSESLTTLEECVVGDQINVRCFLTSTNLLVFMSTSRSWFYGILIK